MQIIAKIRDKMSKFAQQGPSHTLKKSASDHIYKSEEVLLLRLRMKDVSNLRVIEMQDTKIVHAHKLDQLSILLDSFPHKAEIFQGYHDAGLSVFFALRGQDVLGYCWVATDDFYDKHLYKYEFKLADHEIYHFDGFVKPANRGSPVALFVMSTIYSHYLALGYIHAKCAIATNNEVSLKVHKKLGFKSTDEILTTHKLFSRRWTRSNRPQS